LSGYDFTDKRGDDWVCVCEVLPVAWIRLRDSANLDLTPTSVGIHTHRVFTNEPAQWLVDHLGAPLMDFGDLAEHRRRRRINDAFDRGWEAQWRMSNPMLFGWSQYPPGQKAEDHAFRSVPVA
jgi:hypothetical protein